MPSRNFIQQPQLCNLLLRAPYAYKFRIEPWQYSVGQFKIITYLFASQNTAISVEEKFFWFAQNVYGVARPWTYKSRRRPKWSWKLHFGALRNRLYDGRSNNKATRNEGRSHGAAGSDGVADAACLRHVSKISPVDPQVSARNPITPKVPLHIRNTNARVCNIIILLLLLLRVIHCKAGKKARSDDPPFGLGASNFFPFLSSFRSYSPSIGYKYSRSSYVRLQCSIARTSCPIYADESAQRTYLLTRAPSILRVQLLSTALSRRVTWHTKWVYDAVDAKSIIVSF